MKPYKIDTLDLNIIEMLVELSENTKGAGESYVMCTGSSRLTLLDLKKQDKSWRVKANFV